MKSQKLQGNIMQIVLHISAWAVLLGLPLYNFIRWNVPGEFVWIYYINATVNGIIFYSNYLVLVPRYFFNSSRLKYYVSVSLLIVCLYFVSHYTSSFVFNREAGARPPESNRKALVKNRDERTLPIEEREEPRPPGDRHFFRPFGPHIYNYAFNALVITIFALGLRSLERHAQIEKRQKELEKEKLNSELAFLKNQISPHFFFNTLNNIYSLISINAQDSQNAVLKLSRMMRYLLYESESGETKLSNEIDFMNNYIDLMRLRLTDKVKLSVSFPNKYENLTMPPLLFISIIENAFKHGVSYREKSFIDIVMEVSKEMITFRCENSMVVKNDDTSSGNSGIGLDNLTRRLKLLFPERHSLEITKSDSTFLVLVKVVMTKT